MAATDLYDAAAELLAACKEAVAAAPGGAIDRCFVSPGPPAFDCCPQLSVHVGGPVVADTLPTGAFLLPGHRISGPSGSVNLVTLTITVLRCAPGIEGDRLPTPASLEATSQETCGDCWAIWNHLSFKKRAGTLFADDRGNAKSREFYLDPAAPLNIQGNCAGWQMQVRVELPGYEAP